MLRDEITSIIREELLLNRTDAYKIAPIILDLMTLSEEEFSAREVFDACHMLLSLENIEITEQGMNSLRKMEDIAATYLEKENKTEHKSKMIFDFGR